MVLKAESDELTNDIRSKIEVFGFRIEQPENRIQFLRIIDELSEEELLLHIFAHGNLNQLAPYNQRGKEQMRIDGGPVNPQNDLVPYSEICLRIERMISGGKNVIVNMMAVCNSFNSCIQANHFLGFDGKNNDFQESLEVYPLNTDEYEQKLVKLNRRRSELEDGWYKSRKT